jgi:hypothetical protein
MRRTRARRAAARRGTDVDAWDGWPFARAYLLLVAAAFALLGLQVFLFHWRGGFRRWTMYIPVVGAPALVVAGVAGAITREGWIGWLALAVFGVGVLDGVIGIYEHLRGIGERIGGFTLRNAMAGPPPILPVMFMALATTGLLAVVWGAL